MEYPLKFGLHPPWSEQFPIRCGLETVPPAQRGSVKSFMKNGIGRMK
jgi:hypothetical protein